jgi:hypothetical protein
VLKFRNLGLIASTNNLYSKDGRGEFMQSPQTLEFDDFIRVYFSTRFLDDSGKPISKVESVDFSKDWKCLDLFSRPLNVSDPILGAYDEHGIFPFVPFRISDNEILGYISGWSRRVSVDVETAIGICKSFDNGETFNRIGDGPFLAAGTGEPFLVGDPFVIRDGDRLIMYYIFGTSWISDPQKPLAPLDRIYRIGLATSRDGLNWDRNNGNQIISINEDLECQALPSVARYQEGWLMAFCYRNAFDFRRDVTKGYRIGFALSPDGFNWTRLSEKEYTVELDDWNSDMQCYPNLFVNGNQIYLLSNGNQFGKNGFGLHLLESTAK